MSTKPEKITNEQFSGILLKPYFKNKIVLIKFYTDWCGYCNQTIPVFNQLANYYKNDDSIIIGQYDCENEDNKNYINDYINNEKYNYGYKINGYPTIVIYKDCEFIYKYSKERNIKSLITEIENIKK